jgi:hypothetical protein
MGHNTQQTIDLLTCVVSCVTPVIDKIQLVNANLCTKFVTSPSLNQK